MGIYLSTPKTEKASQDGENDKLRYGLSSMQGWRTSMEDAHAAHLDLDSSTSFFGVYDGHGGKAVSKFCAKFLHQQVLKQEAYSTGDIGTSARKAFLRQQLGRCQSGHMLSSASDSELNCGLLIGQYGFSNNRMDEMMCGQRGWRELALLGGKIDQFSGMIDGLIRSPRSSEFNGLTDDWPSEEGSRSDYSGPTCGSTACVAIIRNNQLVVANAGDSRCVISRKGQAYNLSKDHKPDLETEKERIFKAGGYIQCGRVNGSLNLTRAIGDMELKRDKSLPAEKQILTANPDINTVELCDDDDFLVLACDGIWDCMSSQQLVDYVREQLNSESKLSAVCERVFDRCLAPSSGGEGCDNMTMILVQFKKPFNSGPSNTDQPLPSNQPSKSRETTAESGSN